LFFGGDGRSRRGEYTLVVSTSLEDRGNLAFLVRSQSGRFFGIYRRNAQAAAELKLTLSVDNPLRGIDFFEKDDGLMARV